MNRRQVENAIITKIISPELYLTKLLSKYLVFLLSKEFFIFAIEFVNGLLLTVVQLIEIFFSFIFFSSQTLFYRLIFCL